MRGEVSTQISDRKFDEDGLLIVDRKRDEPPLGDGMASVIPFKVVDGVILVANIFDADPRKMKRGLIGGRRKGNENLGLAESPLTTAMEELAEEGGVFRERIEREQLYPVCRITKKGFPNRNEQDQETEERNPIVQYVFARYGDEELHETDDKDAEDPRWSTLEEIISDTINELVDEKGRAKGWLWSHIAALFGSLQLIGSGFELLCKGKLKDEWDLDFFNRVLAEATRKTEKNVHVILDLEDLDLIEIFTDLKGNTEKAVEFVKRFEFEPLGAENYFVAPKKPQSQ